MFAVAAAASCERRPSGDAQATKAPSSADSMSEDTMPAPPQLTATEVMVLQRAAMILRKKYSAARKGLDVETSLRDFGSDALLHLQEQVIHIAVLFPDVEIVVDALSPPTTDIHEIFSARDAVRLRLFKCTPPKLETSALNKRLNLVRTVAPSTASKKELNKQGREGGVDSTFPYFISIDSSTFAVTSQLAKQLDMATATHGDGTSGFEDISTDEYKEWIQYQMVVCIHNYFNRKKLHSRMMVIANAPVSNTQQYKIDAAFRPTVCELHHNFLPLIIELEQQRAQRAEAQEQLREHALHAIKCVPRWESVIKGLMYPIGIAVAGNCVDVYGFVLGHKTFAGGQKMPVINTITLTSTTLSKFSRVLDVLLSEPLLAYYDSLYARCFGAPATTSPPPPPSTQGDIPPALVERIHLSDHRPDEPQQPQQHQHQQPQQHQQHQQLQQQQQPQHHQQQKDEVILANMRVFFEFEEINADVKIIDDTVVKRVPDDHNIDRIRLMWRILHPRHPIRVINSNTIVMPFLGSGKFTTPEQLLCVAEQLLRLCFHSLSHADVRKENIAVRNAKVAFLIDVEDFGTHTPDGFNCCLLERHPDLFCRSGRDRLPFKSIHDFYSLAMAWARPDFGERFDVLRTCDRFEDACRRLVEWLQQKKRDMAHESDGNADDGDQGNADDDDDDDDEEEEEEQQQQQQQEGEEEGREVGVKKKLKILNKLIEGMQNATIL
ncbi:hypothetical protein PTSG_07453 [Salpingoeca rosetta]|uniref:Protein kinase domain-containing protein n=1 Tax=Salpingoeca rosetta (strain ATCC 50818 / BSB-021) TaxID=946362 RepID=F2UIS0_SALR5|nr:uncharacterized protein PTSG_07453 [Salpingoeca rosetta]EGD77119.1 hypothetical protein PTSG_07453 [Salpingoeca rosetta]|eukprot:XP_004990958.1 hypothetical protein PTSG_07453 [Salpingoeca rosetta]